MCINPRMLNFMMHIFKIITICNLETAGSSLYVGLLVMERFVIKAGKNWINSPKWKCSAYCIHEGEFNFSGEEWKWCILTTKENIKTIVPWLKNISVIWSPETWGRHSSFIASLILKMLVYRKIFEISLRKTTPA